MLTDRKADAKVHEVVVGQPTLMGADQSVLGRLKSPTNVMTILSCVTPFKSLTCNIKVRKIGYRLRGNIKARQSCSIVCIIMNINRQKIKMFILIYNKLEVEI